MAKRKNASNNQVVILYNDLLCPVILFRFFIRKLYKGVKISNEDVDGINNEFAEYLYNLNLTEKQKENILPKSEFDVILNLDHPFRMNGFPAAYVLHFTEFIGIMKKEAEAEGFKP